MKETQQRVPLFLIVFAAVCIAVGSHFGWHDLISFGVMFGGGGVGILTGHRFSAGSDSPTT